MAKRIDFYFGWSKAELEAEARLVQQQLSGFVTQTGAGNTSSSVEQRESLEKTLLRIYDSLTLRDPVKYPARQIVKRQSPRYDNPFGGSL